jgi:hypothetical protein
VDVHLAADALEVPGHEVLPGRGARVVDEQGDVSRPLGRGGDGRGIRDVQPQHLHAGEVDGLGTADGGIDLARTALNQGLGEGTPQSAVGAGDEGGRIGDLHATDAIT